MAQIPVSLARLQRKEMACNKVHVVRKRYTFRDKNRVQSNKMLKLEKYLEAEK